MPPQPPTEAPAELNGASHPAETPAPSELASEAAAAPAVGTPDRARPGDREERSLTVQETVKPEGSADDKPEGHDEIEASKAPLMDHLIELRQRMIYALIGVGIGFAICFAFATNIYNLLVLPYVWARGADQKIEMIYTAPHEFFFTKLKLALFGAFLLAFPLIAHAGLQVRGAGPLQERAPGVPALSAVDLRAVHRRRRRGLFHRHAAGHEVLPVDGADGRAGGDPPAGARQRVSRPSS